MFGRSAEGCGKGVDFTEHNQERMMGFFRLNMIRKQCIHLSLSVSQWNLS